MGNNLLGNFACFSLRNFGPELLNIIVSLQTTVITIITTPNRELCVFQEFRKIGFCDYQNVFSRNEEKVNFKVPPVGRKNSDNNISSAKMKFSRNEENVLWILHINNNI